MPTQIKKCSGNYKRCALIFKRAHLNDAGSVLLSAVKALAVLALAPIAGVVLWTTYADQYISSHVHLGATLVGGMTYEEVDPIVEAEIQKIRKLSFTLTDEEGHEQTSLEELGVEVNKSQTISRLFAANKPFWQSNNKNLKSSAPQLPSEIIFAQADVNEPQLRAALRQKLLKREYHPQDASIVWSQESGWEIVSEEEGRKVQDIESTLDRLVADVVNGLADPEDERTYHVAYEIVPAALRADHLQDMLAKLQFVTSKPIHVKVVNHIQPVDIPHEAKKWVNLDYQQQEVFINVDQVKAYAQFIANNNNAEASNMTLVGMTEHPSEYYGGRTYKKAIVEGALITGRKLQESKLVEDFIAAMLDAESENKHVEAIFETIEPKVISNIEGYEFPEMISRGTSDYQLGNSPNRVHNIHHALGIQNFTIVDPGEEFSFNKVGGWVTLDKGYQNGKVIFGTGIGIAPGGGVCQVSTTMFRAAVNAGFPITKRKPHSWDVSYYRDVYGVDAAVYPPNQVDLKFVNDSPGPILIHSYADAPNEMAYFDFYGTSDGREVIVEMSANYRWGTGRIVKNDWIIQRDDGEIERREIISRYNR